MHGFSEKTPLLEADPLSAIIEVPYGSDVTHSYKTRDGHLLKYNAWRVSSFACFVRIGGTVFFDRELWLRVLAYLSVAGGTCAVLRLSFHRLELVDVDKISEVVNGSALLVALLLALNLVVSVHRWFAVRREVLGQLWSAVSDLGMLFGAHLPEKENRPLKTLVLRYGLVSMELLFDTFSEDHRQKDLESLRACGLLSPQECALLEPSLHEPFSGNVLPSLPWVWIAKLCRELAGAEKISSRLLQQLYGICSRGRGACSLAAALQYSQPPFVYAHLLSVLVHVSCMLMALKCGAAAAVGLRAASQSTKHPGAPISDTQTLWLLTSQGLLVIAAPLFYGALLNHAVALTNPFSAGSLGEFPRSAYRAFMRDECEAFHTAGENQPKAIEKVVAQFKETDPLLVHDKVLAV
mmetsp:Transcript_112188/g.194497  ORF Transcript_112188/g.194497 Transcript_112188/m.194497 type:complete len:408 (-) Transcript_112188:72-1295(-)